MTDLTGQVFSRLTVTRRVKAVRKNLIWECHCVCTKVVFKAAHDLMFGRVKSCGCLNQELRIARNTKHNGATRAAKHPLYNSWAWMRQRCRDPNYKDYHLYGGRGISICARWDDFAAFATDMGPRPPGLTLDRIDPDGNYAPDNCRWATWSEQRINQRRMRQPAISRAG